MAKTKQVTGRVDTREALILAGERLIADRGIDGVSLRQINAEAGQRNSSAAHYHFGSKDALIRSIYEYRLDSVNRRRQQLVDAVLAEKRDHDVRSIVETFVRPIVDEIQQSEGGTYYVRFLALAIGHPQADVRAYTDGIVTEAAQAAYQLLKKVLPEIPEPILGQRFGLMWELIIHSLADRERFGKLSARADDSESEVFINNLVDVVAGGLSTPVSVQTATRSAGARPRR